MPTKNRKEILVFGATGGTGQAIVHEALKRGYGVTVFVRNIQHAQHIFNGKVSELTFCEGDALNADAVQQAIESRTHAVISAMGVYQSKRGSDDLTKATTNILNAMNTSGSKRFLCISSIGVGDSRGQGDFVTRMIQKTVLRFTLADKKLQEAAIQNSNLDWTLIRPSRLMDKGAPAQYLTWTGQQPAQKLVWTIDRSQVASLTLDCLEDDKSIGQAINVTGMRVANATSNADAA
jgi:uncharacterized protein YbjT (DUF2867 family)